MTVFTFMCMAMIMVMRMAVSFLMGMFMGMSYTVMRMLMGVCIPMGMRHYIAVFIFDQMHIHSSFLMYFLPSNKD